MRCRDLQDDNDHANSFADTRSGTSTCTDTNTDSHADADADTNTDTDTDSHANTNTSDGNDGDGVGRIDSSMVTRVRARWPIVLHRATRAP